MYHFSVRQERKLTATQVRRLERIAKRHGASFVYINEPGNRHKSWFSCPNMGHPFDKAVADAVRADIEREMPDLDSHV